MSYLGNAPARSFISFERQVFTIVNSQTAYALSHSVTNENDIRLVINNVVQEPGSGKAYTATGTALTLSAALTNGTDEMYCVFLGRATATNAPGAGSVGTAQLADDAVTADKLASGAGGVAGIVSSANATAMTIDSNEQVGIGTGSPSEKLHIETSSGDADVLLHAAEDNSGSDARLFLKTTNTSATPSLFFGDSANDGMGYVKYLNNGNSMQFGTNAAHQWSLDSSGNFLPAATDHGIYLGVTSATAANLLDDYEEGSFTPAYSFDSGSVTMQGGGNTRGHYVKVGNLVHFQIYMATTGISSPSGDAIITGLPITTGNQSSSSAAIGLAYRYNTNMTLKARISQGGTTIQLWKNTTGSSSSTAVQGSDFQSGNAYNNLHIAGCYSTA